MRSILCALLLLISTPAFAATTSSKPVIADISQYRIEIDSRFTGTNLLLFGARNDIGDIVVVVRGPERNFIVRKKERVAGLWVNAKQVAFKRVPNYYMVASSKPFVEMRDVLLFNPLRVGVDSLLNDNSSTQNDRNLYEFQWAFLEYQRKHQLFSEGVTQVNFMEDTLFKTAVPFPDNIPRGAYTAEVYLFNEGQLMSMQSIPIRIYKKGFDAFVYDLAYQYPIFYGMIAVIIALGAGWGASEIFRKI